MEWFSTADISYAAIMYYLVFNTLVIVAVGYCGVSSASYPYSCSFFVKAHKRQTNKRFGAEFMRCTERMCRVVQDMSESQSFKNTSAILLAQAESTEPSLTDSQMSH